MAIKKSLQVANSLRRDIVQGRFGRDGGLPELREIARELDAAVNTVVAAIALLEGQGLVTQRGKNYYVNNLAFVMTSYVPPVHMRPTQFSRNLAPVTRTKLPERIVARLQLDPAPDAVLRMQVQGEGENGTITRPFNVCSYWYLLSVSDADIAHMNEDANYDGVMHETTPARMECHDEIVARLPTAQEADLLHVSMQTPVHSLFITIGEISGSILMVQEIVLAAHVTLVYDYVFENKPK